MNEEGRMLAEIRDANLSYLMLAQRLIREDRVEALYRLGIPEEVASLIEALSPSQVIRIAAANTLLCRVRFDEEMVWSLLADHGAVERGGAASRLHASILMAGRHAETA